MMEASVQPPGTVGRFLSFVATGLALSLLPASLIVAVDEGNPYARVHFPFPSIVIGWVLCGAIVVLSSAPGLWIIRSTRRPIRGRRTLNVIGTEVVSTAIAAVEAPWAHVAVNVGQRRLPGHPDGRNRSQTRMPESSADLLGYGAPAVLLPGFAVYQREDRRLV